MRFVDGNTLDEVYEILSPPLQEPPLNEEFPGVLRDYT